MKKNTPNASSRALLIATIANRTKGPLPFSNTRENNSYAHLAGLCQQLGIDLYIAHFANLLSGARILAWKQESNQWKCGIQPLGTFAISYADLPQNFPVANALRLALLDHRIPIVNPLALSDLCTDKLASYELLPQYFAPTFKLEEATLYQHLINIPYHSDLSTAQLILKPRYGERGKGIKVINLQDLEQYRSRKPVDYLVQPIINTETGIPALGIKGRHDLRILIHNGQIVQVYARIPPAEQLISNTSYGGQIHYFEVAALPQRIRQFVLGVDQHFTHYTPRFYSIDIGVSPTGRIWIFEFNTMPGIVWKPDCEQDQQKNREMHQVISQILREAKGQRDISPGINRQPGNSLPIG